MPDLPSGIMNREFLTPSDIHETTKYSMVWIYKNLRSENLKSMRIGRNYFIKPKDLQTWLDTINPAGRPRTKGKGKKT